MQRALSETTPDGRTPDARARNLRSRLPPIPGSTIEDLEHAPTDVAPPLDPTAFDGATDVDAHGPTEQMDIAAVPQAVAPARDMTELVMPLSVYAQTRVPARHRRKIGWQPIALAVGALVVLGGVATAVVMWPSDDAKSAAAPDQTAQVMPVKEEMEATQEKEAEEETKQEPAAPPQKSAMQMTQADYERERAAAAAEDAGVAAKQPAPEPIAKKEPEPIAKQPEPEPIAKQPEPEPIAKKPEPEPIAKKPVAKRTTTKAPTKRTVKAQAKVAPAPTKKPPAKKAATKPKWNPDDLFLDGK